MSSIDPNADIHTRLAIAEAALKSIGQQLDPAINHVDIAVLIPCFNEGKTIADVVRSFHVALPNARIYVYDNNSQDNTAAEARDAGAIVRREPLQGKGYVVRRCSPTSKPTCM
jgi:cellulose synthase/poly-beta-1,6-N-acetylglucosamine synthase-like glycosyltransferase